MKEIEKNLKTARLIDFYGELLTKHQKKVLTDYFFENLSLTEIGESNGTSRQAVSENISSAVKKLETYEAKLGNIKTYEKLLDLKKIIETSNTNEKILKEIDDILESINGTI